MVHNFQQLRTKPWSPSQNRPVGLLLQIPGKQHIRLGEAKVSEDGLLSMNWWHIKEGAGIWKLDEVSLEVVGAYPESRPELSPALLRAELDYPGMTVRTASGRVTDDAAVEPGVDRYLLRWETLRTNRDQPRDEIPPPSELRLYALGSED